MKALGAWLQLIGILLLCVLGFVVGVPILFFLVWLPDCRQKRRYLRALRHARRVDECNT